MSGINTIQLNPPLRVSTTHGEGWAILYESYGIDFNGAFLVANLADGKMRWYDCVTEMVWQGGNFTFGIKEHKINNQLERSKNGKNRNHKKTSKRNKPRQSS